jgi:hypothetical protein
LRVLGGLGFESCLQFEVLNLGYVLWPHSFILSFLCFGFSWNWHNNGCVCLKCYIVELFCLQNSVVSIDVIFVKCIHVPIAKYQTSLCHPPSAGLVYFFVCVFAPIFCWIHFAANFLSLSNKECEKKLSFIKTSNCATP